MMIRTEEISIEEQDTALAKFPEWIRKRQLTKVVRITYDIPAQPDMNALAKFTFEAKVPRVDVPLLRPDSKIIDPDTVMGIALYPSGATRTIGTAREIKDEAARLAIFGAWDLLDPDDEGALQLGQDFTGNLLVLAVFVDD